jgi:hypothetical protein
VAGPSSLLSVEAPRITTTARIIHRAAVSSAQFHGTIVTG